MFPDHIPNVVVVFAGIWLIIDGVGYVVDIFLKQNQKNCVDTEDEELIKAYIIGVSDELLGKTPKIFTGLADKAYDMGREDVSKADSISQLDYQTSEDLVMRIREE